MPSGIESYYSFSVTTAFTVAVIPEYNFTSHSYVPNAFISPLVSILRLSTSTPYCFLIASAISFAVTEPNSFPPCPAFAKIDTLFPLILFAEACAASVSCLILNAWDS